MEALFLRLTIKHFCLERLMSTLQQQKNWIEHDCSNVLEVSKTISTGTKVEQGTIVVYQDAL